MSDSSILEKCCLIGETVAGNPTHFMIERAFADAELDWRFLTFEVDSRRLGDALRGVDALGMHGALLLGPLREAAVGCFDTLTDRARRTGSVTFFERDSGGLLGDDLAGEAAIAVAGEHGPVEGRRVALLGAARVAHSLADAALSAGAAALWVADRHLESAERLAQALAKHHPGATVEPLPWEDETLDTPDGVDLLVSSACWPKARDERLAAAVGDCLRRGMTVVDARLSSSRTPLLHEAAARGAAVVDGLDLLTRETVLAIQRWTGVLVDRAGLKEAAEEFLGV